jgi:catechol 2,3-dioxygenase
LAVTLQSLLDNNYPISGASDHGVSEAIYLEDPDGIGIELYWDRPKNEWPKTDAGDISMVTESLDLQDLLSEIKK